jgi:hypothetical protein
MVFLLTAASGQPGIDAGNITTTALKELVIHSGESLDTYRFTFSQDQRIEIINLTDGNTKYLQLISLGKGTFNFTGKAMKLATSSLSYPVGHEENTTATMTEVYLLNETLYSSVNGNWTATPLPLSTSIWSTQARLNQSAELTNISEVRLLGTMVIDGESLYVVEVVPRKSGFSSLIDDLIGPRFSISSLDLRAFFNNTQLRYALWISANNHTPVAEYAHTNTTLTPEKLGPSSKGNIEYRLDATTTLMLSDFNKSAIILLPEQAKLAQISSSGPAPS